MTVLVFENIQGEKKEVLSAPGESVMQAAVRAGVEEIAAECGGACSCATCHCYVEKGIFLEAGKIESEMLGCVLNFTAKSRLSCQLIIKEDMEDIVIKLPEWQY